MSVHAATSAGMGFSAGYPRRRATAAGSAATIRQGPLPLAAKIALSLWCGAFLLSPFYLFDSGLPQIADCLLALLTAWLVVIRGVAIAPKTVGLVATAGGLTAYIAAVNGCWTVLVSDTELLLYTLFYIFNLAALIDAAVLYHWLGRRFGEATGMACFASVVLQAALSFVIAGGEGDARQTMFFNNPNQLGYYAVLFGSLFWAWSQWTQRPRSTVILLECILYAAGGWLTIVSQSRGGIAAFALLVALRAILRANVAFVGVVVLLGGLLLQTDLPFVDSFKARLEHKSQGTNEELSYRGYDRMYNHPQYLALGAGEGAYWRFISDHHGEMHSTFGSLLFCYGIIGLGLFLGIFWIVLRDAGLKTLMFLVPASAYGLSHNGLRQSELWILFALVVCLHSRWGSKRPQPRFAPSKSSRPIPVATTAPATAVTRPMPSPVPRTAPTRRPAVSARPRRVPAEPIHPRQRSDKETRR